jgi:hypothetical protein
VTKSSGLKWVAFCTAGAVRINSAYAAAHDAHEARCKVIRSRSAAFP